MLSGSTWIHADGGEVQCPIDPPVGRYFARRLMDGSLASKTGPPVGHPDLQSEEGCKARMHPQAGGAWTGGAVAGARAGGAGTRAQGRLSVK